MTGLIQKLCVLFLINISFFNSKALAQKPWLNDVSVGLEFAFPVGDYAVSNKAYGYVYSIRAERNINMTLAITGYAAINHYRGEMVFWDGQKDQAFTLMPLLVGLRKNFKPFYASLEIGPAFGLSSNVRGNLAVSPSIGKKIGCVDFSLRLFSMPINGGNLTQNFLKRGDYHYLGLSVGYFFMALRKNRQ